MHLAGLFGEVLTVTGSRSITEGQFIFDCLDSFVKEHNLDIEKLTLNSGKAKGVDTIAEAWATVRGVKVVEYPADWTKYGRAAGMVRNKVMVDNCGYVCGIWDGKSSGTKGCIDYAKKCGKIITVYEVSKK